jgi:hypothetical protein
MISQPTLQLLFVLVSIDLFVYQCCLASLQKKLCVLMSNFVLLVISLIHSVKVEQFWCLVPKVICFDNLISRAMLVWLCYIV